MLSLNEEYLLTITFFFYNFILICFLLCIYRNSIFIQVALLKMEDAGNYTCSLEAPLRMKAVARVHVLQGWY